VSSKESLVNVKIGGLCKSIIVIALAADAPIKFKIRKS